MTERSVIAIPGSPSESVPEGLLETEDVKEWGFGYQAYKIVQSPFKDRPESYFSPARLSIWTEFLFDNASHVLTNRSSGAQEFTDLSTTLSAYKKSDQCKTDLLSLIQGEVATELQTTLTSWIREKGDDFWNDKKTETIRQTVSGTL